MPRSGRAWWARSCAFFFSSRRRHTRCLSDWSSDVCSSDLVGSRNEKPGKTGIAHLFEHLMFNETEGLAAGEFDRQLEELGAESNASTWLRSEERRVGKVCMSRGAMDCSRDA